MPEPEPGLAADTQDKEWDWDCQKIHSPSAPSAASFALLSSQPSVRLCLLFPILCQQRLSPDPVVSDQLHPCLTSCLHSAHHAMPRRGTPCHTHRPCGRMVSPKHKWKEDGSWGQFCAWRVMISILVWENESTILVIWRIRRKNKLGGKVLLTMAKITFQRDHAKMAYYFWPHDSFQ